MVITYGFNVDPTSVLLVIGMLLSLAASAKLRSTFAVYKKVRSHSGITGAEAAQRILRAAGITDVQVVPISGSLTDHYDPRTKDGFPFRRYLWKKFSGGCGGGST